MMNKIQLVECMNELVLAIGDEDIIDGWLMNGVPDQATQEDYKFISENEECFKDTVELFIKYSKYFKDGLYLFEKWYGTKG